MLDGSKILHNAIIIPFLLKEAIKFYSQDIIPFA